MLRFAFVTFLAAWIGHVPVAAAEFALIAPADALALRSAPAIPERAAAIRAAERMLTRAPRAMARVHVEGTLPGQGIHDESREALRDLPAARDLALAARLTGEARFAEAAGRIVGAWANIYRPSFNPIDETGFDMLFIAWDLLPPEHRAAHMGAMTGLLRGFAEGYLNHTLRGSTATNNWNSHRVKLIALAAWSLGDAELVRRAREAFAAQLRANIRADGATVDFAQRDAIHYVVYSLEPLALTVLAAQQHGQDWRQDGDGALPRSLAWLEPYVAGTKSHDEFARTTVTFDITRRNAGLAGFAGRFEPAEARLLMAYAARLDARYAPLARSLRAQPSQNAWLEVVLP